MKLANDVQELEATFGVESLKPFGLKVTALKEESLSAIGPALLDALVRREKLVLLRGFSPLKKESFLEFCLAYPKRRILEWSFGPVMEMKEQPDARNYLFSRQRVPFHWDGAFHEVPAFLVFNCVAAPPSGTGGETLFCNTELLWQSAAAEQRAKWAKVELRYRTAKLAHYGGEISGPLVQTHPGSGHTILRYAESVTTDLNPVSMEILGLPLEAHGEFMAELENRIHAPDTCYRHAWKENDFLIADNHSLIHGRTAFEQHSPRHLRRIQLI